MPTYSPSQALVEHGGKKISLDHPDGEIAFVSHAHSDHSSFLGKAKTIIASEETLALWQARTGKKFLGENVSSHDGVKLCNAGHVLGARQILVEGDGESFVYTGDFNSVSSLTCPAAKPVECDVLVAETTYGSPEYSFPPRESVYEQICNWVSQAFEGGENVVLGGYSLGKAQELIKLLNEFLAIAPLVNNAIAEISRVYSKHGCRLDFVELGSFEAERLLQKNFVAVLPMHSVTPELASTLESHYHRPARAAVATGWALSNSYAGVDEAFPLSDHSDFNSLLEFVQQTGAKKVFCTHGFEEQFAAALQKKGIDAIAASSRSTQRASGAQAKPRKTLLQYSL